MLSSVSGRQHGAKEMPFAAGKARDAKSAQKWKETPWNLSILSQFWPQSHGFSEPEAIPLAGDWLLAYRDQRPLGEEAKLARFEIWNFDKRWLKKPSFG